MPDSGGSKVIDVLLVEDDEGDVLMTKEAFEYYKIRNRLHVVSDGDQALQFLRRTGPFDVITTELDLAEPESEQWISRSCESYIVPRRRG